MAVGIKSTHTALPTGVAVAFSSTTLLHEKNRTRRGVAVAQTDVPRAIKNEKNGLSVVQRTILSPRQRSTLLDRSISTAEHTGLSSTFRTKT